MGLLRGPETETEPDIQSERLRSESQAITHCPWHTLGVVSPARGVLRAPGRPAAGAGSREHLAGPVRRAPAGPGLPSRKVSSCGEA